MKPLCTHSLVHFHNHGKRALWEDSVLKLRADPAPQAQVGLVERLAPAFAEVAYGGSAEWFWKAQRDRPDGPTEAAVVAVHLQKHLRLAHGRIASPEEGREIEADEALQQTARLRRRIEALLPGPKGFAGQILTSRMLLLQCRIADLKRRNAS